MDRWMVEGHEWLSGRMDAAVEGRIAVGICGWVDGQMARGWKDGWMDGGSEGGMDAGTDSGLFSCCFPQGRGAPRRARLRAPGRANEKGPERVGEPAAGRVACGGAGGCGSAGPLCFQGQPGVKLHVGKKKKEKSF